MRLFYHFWNLTPAYNKHTLKWSKVLRKIISATYYEMGENLALMVHTKSNTNNIDAILLSFFRTIQHKTNIKSVVLFCSEMNIARFRLPEFNLSQRR